jgi:hypothetical protein
LDQRRWATAYWPVSWTCALRPRRFRDSPSESECRSGTSFAIDHHGLDSLGDHSFGDILAAGARHLEALAALDSNFVGQLDRNFDERLRHQFHVSGIVLGPVVAPKGTGLPFAQCQANRANFTAPSYLPVGAAGVAMLPEGEDVCMAGGD